MSLEPKRPVTLEDLLRLKRAERPPAEFWEQFDRELRAKQLAALVEKRPWWRSLPQVLGSVRRHMRYSLPLGATAVLGVTYLVLRHEAPVPPAQPGMNALVASTPSREASVQDVAVARAAAVPPAAEFSAVSLVSAEKPGDVSPVAAAPRESGRSESGAAGFIAAGARLPEGGESTEVRPSARLIAANLMVAQMTDPHLSRGVLPEAVSNAIAIVPRSSAEPLAQVASAGQMRYARLRTAMAAPIVNTMVRATDRVARDLSDERLSEDGIRRFAAKGDRLSVRF